MSEDFKGVAEMKTRLIDGIEVHRSFGNVFADLGLADADKFKIKTGLVIEIRKAMRTRGLTQQEATKRMGSSAARSWAAIQPPASTEKPLCW